MFTTPNGAQIGTTDRVGGAHDQARLYAHILAIPTLYNGVGLTLGRIIGLAAVEAPVAA